MRKIWKWRWIIFIILVIIDIIGISITYYFIQNVVLVLISIIGIQIIIPVLYKLIIVHFLKKTEEKEKIKEKKKITIVRREPIRIVLCSLYRSYKKSPSVLIISLGMMDVINSNLNKSDILSEADLIFALDYLESKV